MPHTFKARWAFPVDSPPLEDGEVAIEDGRILAVGRGLRLGRTHDLGDAALLPGLINAHSHLEFSDLAAPLGLPGMPFPSWIREVVARRRSANCSRAGAVKAGILESAAAGIAALGDVASPDWPREAYRSSSLAVTIFQEQLALAEDRSDEKMAEARRHLTHDDDANAGLWKLGLSPHAPYTVHPRLFAGLVELAAERHAPLAFHLAESPEELELLATGRGPFRQLLDDLGAWQPQAIPFGTRPRDYLQALAGANVRGLVVHGNYLQDDELDLLAAYARRLSVVYCPRTHAYFGHAPYPLTGMLARGVRVAIGTDSRASTPDLNLWADMLCVAQRHPDVPLYRTLELGTLAGAAALGIDDEFGSLTVGKRANLCVVKLAASATRGAHESLFQAMPGDIAPLRSPPPT